MFSLQTFFNACFNLKHNVVAVLTALVITTLFITFSTNAVQASHNEGPYVIGTTVNLGFFLNCEDVASTEAGKAALLDTTESWLDTLNQIYEQKGCYKGGKVEIIEQVGGAFDSPRSGTVRMVKVKRNNGVFTIAMVLNDIMTQAGYDLSRALIVGEKPSLPNIPYCNSAEDVLAVLENIRKATAESWNTLVVKEFNDRECVNMPPSLTAVLNGYMTIQEQIGEKAKRLTDHFYRAVRISVDDADDIFALVLDQKILTPEQAAEMRKENEEK